MKERKALSNILTFARLPNQKRTRLQGLLAHYVLLSGKTRYARSAPVWHRSWHRCGTRRVTLRDRRYEAQGKIDQWRPPTPKTDRRFALGPPGPGDFSTFSRVARRLDYETRSRRGCNRRLSSGRPDRKSRRSSDIQTSSSDVRKLASLKQKSHNLYR